MILPDVNVLLYAFRDDNADHDRYHGWLEGLVNGDEAYGMSPQLLCSVVRIATHPRIYVSPSRLEDTLAFARVLLEQPHCTVVRPGTRHFYLPVTIAQRRGSRPGERLGCVALRQPPAVGFLLVARRHGPTMPVRSAHLESHTRLPVSLYGPDRRNRPGFLSVRGSTRSRRRC